MGPQFTLNLKTHNIGGGRLDLNPSPSSMYFYFPIYPVFLAFRPCLFFVCIPSIHRLHTTEKLSGSSSSIPIPSYLKARISRKQRANMGHQIKFNGPDFLAVDTENSPSYKLPDLLLKSTEATHVEGW